MIDAARIRRAAPADARAIARVHVESWRTAYAGILPDRVLVQMSAEQKTAAWRREIETRGKSQAVLVAELADGTVAGFASCASGGGALSGFDGEIHMLYVLPDWQEQGLGRALLCGCLELLGKAGCRSAMVWALAGNPSRFFYEAMGAVRVGERHETLWGVKLHEVAYGWRDLSSLPAARRKGRPP
jgi:GNAT superfamily N-acetyltransferase